MVGEEPGTSCSLVEWSGNKQDTCIPKLIAVMSGSMSGVWCRGGEGKEIGYVSGCVVWGCQKGQVERK